MPAPISEYVPQFASAEGARRLRRAAWRAWCFAAAVALLFVGAVALAPFLRARGWFVAAQVFYQGFSAACHQMPERSFHVEGFPLAVCARCSGLYAGALFGVLAYPLVRSLRRTDAPGRWWLLAAALPTSVDFALGVLGLWENTHFSRFLTALVLGAASASYIVPGAVGLAFRYGSVASRRVGEGAEARTF
jgi:uncharacterized membrane protein